MFEVFQNPQMFHAATSHVPIALAILGIPLVLLALIMPKSHAVRWIAVGAYGLLILTALIAVNAGEAVEGNVAYDAPSAVIDDLDQHEWLAKKVWITGAAVAALLLISAIPHELVRRLSVTVALLASIVCAGWIATTAQHGGRLVYAHGVGLPRQRPTEPTKPVEPPLDEADPNDPNTPNTPNGDPTPPIVAQGNDHDDQPNEAGEGASHPMPPRNDGSGDVPIVDAADLTNPLHPFAARYTLQIKPLLEERCFNCHNSRRRSGPAAGLDLTTIESLMRGGDGGPVVIPGKPAESLLVIAVTYEDQFVKMPPLEDDRLSAEEIDILRNWIASAKSTTPIGP